MTPGPSDPTTDLDLSAIAYVQGQMTDAEVEAFENQLADDQTARESVERAALWIEAAEEIGAPAVAGRIGWVKPLAAAAAITLAAGLAWWATPATETPGTTDTPALVESEALIDAWVQLGSDHDDIESEPLAADLESDRSHDWLSDALETQTN